MSSDLQRIEEARKKVTTGADIVGDAAFIMDPYNNWEEKIIPAPFTIAILGQLVIISDSQDFPLKQPQDGFKLVRWPESFRANIFQVNGEGYKAFNTAHHCMDEIRLSTKNVSQHLLTAIKILIEGTDYDVEHMLPLALHKIEDIANTCRARSDEVALKFQSVMNLVLELQQACVATYSATEEQKRNIELQIKMQNIKDDNLKEQKTRYKEQYKRMNEEVKKSSARYDEAIKELPKAGEILGLTVLESVTNAVQSLSSVLSFGKKICSGDFSFLTEFNKPMDPKGNEKSISYDDIQLYTIGKGLSDGVEIFQKYFDHNGSLIDISAADEDSTFGFQELFFKNQKEIVLREKGSLKIKNEILKICDEAFKLCRDIKKRVREGNVGAAENLYKQMQVISDASNELNLRCREVLLMDPMSGSTPNMAKKSLYKVSGSITKQRIRNAHFNVEAATGRLQLAERQFEKSAEDMMRNNEAMTKCLVRMAAFKAEKATHKEIIDILQDGILKLGILQEKWSHLSEFFTHISALIKTGLETQLTLFVGYSEKAREQHLKENVKMSDVIRDTIYRTVFEAVKYSSLVHHLASGYWEVSDQYLMRSVSKLGQLLTLKSEYDKQVAQMALMDECEETQKAIEKKISDHRTEFKRKINYRMTVIKKEFESVLPALSESDVTEVKSIAARALEDVPLRPTCTVDDYATFGV